MNEEALPLWQYSRTEDPTHLSALHSLLCFRSSQEKSVHSSVYFFQKLPHFANLCLRASLLNPFQPPLFYIFVILSFLLLLSFVYTMLFVLVVCWVPGCSEWHRGWRSGRTGLWTLMELWVSLFRAGSWIRWPLGVPSKSNHAMSLWNACLLMWCTSVQLLTQPCTLLFSTITK